MRPYFLLFVLLWLAGCDPKKPTAQQEAAPPRQPPSSPAAASAAPPHPRTLADTIAPYTILAGFFDSAKVASQVRINGVLYRLQLAVRPDSTRPLRYVAPANADRNDSTQVPATAGFAGSYTFRLLRPDGTTQFVKTLQKSDFAAEVGEELAVEAGTVLPVFSGFLPAFNALAFEVSFYPDGSDNGGEALLLLDATTGRVVHQGIARWNSGCNSATVLSKDGRTLLTSTEILQANGRNTAIDNRPGRGVAGTLLVNNQTVLVAYISGYDSKGHELPLKGPNAELLDLNGRKLAVFNLESTDGGLGYRMLSKYVGQTRSHYLFDETNGKLGIISTEKPTPARILKLSQIPVFQAPQRPSEVRIHFNPESGTQAAFYIDTVSGSLRHRISKPAY